MKFFIHKDDKQHGPFEKAELDDKISAGEFNRTDLAWDDSSESWKSLGQMLSPAPEAKGAEQPPAPPEPPLASPEKHPLEAGHGEAFGMHDAADLGVSKAFSSTVAEFKALDYKFLLPLGKVFTGSLLKKKAVRWVLFLALAPIAIGKFAFLAELTFPQVVWCLQIYFCLFWALYFYSLIAPSSAIWKRAIGYAAFTAIVGVALVLAVHGLPIIRTLYADSDSDNFLLRVLGFTLGVGMLEELCKALPLLVFGLGKGKIHGVREGLFLGLMSGFGFAAAEGVLYTGVAKEIVVQAAGGFNTFTGQLLQTYFRMMSGPVLHGAWAGIVGWFIGVASTRTTARWPTIVIGVAFAAVLHGLNDVFAGGFLHLVVAGASILIFMAYLVHGEQQRGINASESSMGSPEPPTDVAIPAIQGVKSL